MGLDTLGKFLPFYVDISLLCGAVYAHLIFTSAIDYIQFLIQQKKKQEDELDSLRKEVMALKIMKA